MIAAPFADSKEPQQAAGEDARRWRSAHACSARGTDPWRETRGHEAAGRAERMARPVGVERGGLGLAGASEIGEDGSVRASESGARGEEWPRLSAALQEAG